MKVKTKPNGALKKITQNSTNCSNKTISYSTKSIVKLSYIQFYYATVATSPKFRHPFY